MPSTDVKFELEIYHPPLTEWFTIGTFGSAEAAREHAVSITKNNTSPSDFRIVQIVHIQNVLPMFTVDKLNA